MDFLQSILLFCIGGIIAILVDVTWWHVNYKKIEKGMEIIEHYHIGLGFLITALVANYVFEPFAWLLAGLGFVFIVAEWHQTVEIAGKKVIPGKPFAWGSTHFLGSSIIGIILSGILIIFSLIL